MMKYILSLVVSFQQGKPTELVRYKCRYTFTNYMDWEVKFLASKFLGTSKKSEPKKTPRNL